MTASTRNASADYSAAAAAGAEDGRTWATETYQGWLSHDEDATHESAAEATQRQFGKCYLGGWDEALVNALRGKELAKVLGISEKSVDERDDDYYAACGAYSAAAHEAAAAKVAELASTGD